MKKTKLMLCAAVMATLLWACGKSDDAGSIVNLAYLPVQMSEGDEWSIIDKEGKTVVNEEYSADALVSKVYDGSYWVVENNIYRLFNLDNPKIPVLDEEFTEVTDFDGGVAAVVSNNQPIRLIDPKGRTVAVLPETVTICREFSRGGYAVIVESDGMQSLINTRGEVMIPPHNWDYELSENEGLVMVREKDTPDVVKILTVEGNKVGEFSARKYDLLTVVSEGKILVSRVGMDPAPLVVLDKTGEPLFEIKKSSAELTSYIPFMDGYFVYANESGKYGVVNGKGEVVIRPKYEYMFNIGGGLFEARKQGKTGIVDEKDNTVIPFEYESYQCSMGGNFVMKDYNEYCLITRDNKKLATFDNYGLAATNTYVEYINMSAIVADAAIKILQIAKPMSAIEIFEGSDESAEEWNFRRIVNNVQVLAGKLNSDVYFYFDNPIVDREYPDGSDTPVYKFSSEVPERVTGGMTVMDSSIDTEPIYKFMVEKLEDAGYTKDEEGTLIKTFDVNGKKYQSRVRLMCLTEKIDIGIRFVELD